MEEVKQAWVGGICIKDGKVLLIHRINKERLFNQEYFVFPGKDISHDETRDQALTEIFSELGLTIARGELLYEKDDLEDLEYYYACDITFGNLATQAAPDIETTEQYYTPMWVAISELDELIVYPESVKELLVQHEDKSAKKI